jgi:superfamily II DNA or RNA helicase
MHHVSSPTFSKLLDTNYARYKIGLSGTIERKDGKHVVFRDYFGQKIFQPPKENYMIPKVVVVRPDIRFMDGSGTPWATKVSVLCNDNNYRNLIAMLAAAQAAKGHNVLVVCDRVAFLHVISEMIGENAVCVTGKIHSDDREALIVKIGNGTVNVLCGTQSIFSEGISVDILSCLILATPVNNEPLLTQLVGRVVRKLPNKPQPIVMDIHLKGNTARRQASNRMGHYIKQGYEISYL